MNVVQQAIEQGLQDGALADGDENCLSAPVAIDHAIRAASQRWSDRKQQMGWEAQFPKELRSNQALLFSSQKKSLIRVNSLDQEEEK